MRRLLILIAMVVAGAVVTADTLILRDGSRVTGRLVGADEGTIEFEERGSGRRTVVRSYDRSDILRIEFDRGGSGFVDEPTRPSRPSGLRERLVIVSGDVAWNDADITLRANQEIWLESSGRVQWGRGRRHGPAGEPNSPRNDGRPMPSRNAAALIGKIGDRSTDYFFLGDETGPIRIRTGGRLFLGVNDDFLNDNSENFRVVVYY
ncbi:MAG: hypothetical protein O2917_05495 [Acidobacteria bacterium]|nr:hypothetical protein [Acidobacteriota bacterium]